MKSRICLIIITAILLLSVIGLAEDNSTEQYNSTEKTKVVVASKDIGIDQNLSKDVVVASIATNKIGHLIYMEEYYSKNDSDPNKVKLVNKVIYYNGTMTNNTLTLKIKRPLNSNGERYKYIKAVAYIDNKKELNSWFKYKNGDTNMNKKSPGFEIVLIILTTSIVYLLIKREK